MTEDVQKNGKNVIELSLWDEKNIWAMSWKCFYVQKNEDVVMELNLWDKKYWSNELKVL